MSQTVLFSTIQFSISIVSVSKTVPFQIIQFSVSTQFKYKYSLIAKTFLFQTIHFSKTVLIQTIKFSISTEFTSILPIHRDLSVATIPGHRGPGSNGDEGLLLIPQISNMTGNSPSDCLASYLGHLLGVLPLCKGAVIVFYSPNQLSKA